ncbi:hypothetical protein FQA39_LY10728 [Lamprigera yunnana]|nr:hypothetical protein FQA39_LY10728 [Lamprigera yunnana]
MPNLHIDEEYNAMPTLFYMDDYDVCMSLKEKALYCSVTVQLSPLTSPNVTIWNIIHKVSSNPRNYRHDRLRHKICVATTCPSILKNYSSLRTNYDLLRDEISECYNSKYNHLHLTGVVTQMYCETDKTGRPIDNWDIAVASTPCLALVIAFNTTWMHHLRNGPLWHDVVESEYQNCRKNWWSTIVLWWIVILGIPLTVIFIAYPFYQSDEYSRTGAAIYNSLSRNMFAFALALAIFGATQKIGWFLRSCVVWPLTTVVDFTIACIFGLLLCLFVEMPTSALQKMMMPQMKNKRNQLEERKITNISVISNNHQMSKV